MLLALLPLALHVFHPEPTLEDRLQRTFAAHPELPDRLMGAGWEKGLTADQFFSLLPGNRYEGALLPYSSHLHWLMALGAAGLFLAVFAAAIPRISRLGRLVWIAFFTSTVGIVLLLFFQWNAALSAQSTQWVISFSFSELWYLAYKFIGFSYSAADNPNNGFILSFLGFTCGVGLCEELTKAIPLLFAARKSGEPLIAPQRLLLWGLVSGMGFGIAEGILYAGSQYNGSGGPATYVVRFFSCVALHGVWAGIFALILHTRVLWMRDAYRWWNYLFEVLLVVLIPAVLHGLYDTLLKGSHLVLALLVAVGSTLFLAYLIGETFKAPPTVVTASPPKPSPA